MNSEHFSGKSLGALALRCATAAVLAVGLMLPATGLQAFGEEVSGGGSFTSQ